MTLRDMRSAGVKDKIVLCVIWNHVMRAKGIVEGHLHRFLTPALEEPTVPVE
jgi:hypothetical protein